MPRSGKASKVEPVFDPLFSVYEDHGYKKYFMDSYDVMTKYDSGDLSVEEAKQELGKLLQAYQFKIPLRDRCEGQEWAMKHSLVRHVFLGVKERHERWVNEQIDDHLARTNAVR